MKKSHSSICSLFFIVTTSNLVMTMAGCSSAGGNIKTPFSHQNAVVKIFQKFNAQKPLVIPYLGTDIPQDITKKSVTNQIYDTLVQKYPDIFTKTVWQQITFENTKLKPGITTAVQVTYQTINQQFYVRETTNSHPYQQIYDALATCTAQQPLLVPYLGEHPRTSSQSIVYALRKSLTKRAPKILSSTIVDSIYFDDIELKPNTVKAVGATYRNTTKQIYVRETFNQELNQVFNALKQFSQPTKPLNIGYLGSEHETYSAETKVVTQAVKQVLKKVNPVFTDQCLSKISLGDINMIPGKSVKVSLLYHLDQQKSFYRGIDIYIHENSSKLKESATAIASKIQTGTALHLKGFCQNQAMDTPKITAEIRKTLVGYELLSKLEAQYVILEHLMLTGNNKYQLQVIKDGVTAKTVPITFIVEKSAVIIPWEASDYVFHFILYLDPFHYSVLRTYMISEAIKQGNDFYLGTFMQMLNDYQFLTGSANNIYFIPWDPDFLHSYSIVGWDNRLENHMGHFGRWSSNKSQTADRMVATRRIDVKRNACANIMSLYNSFKVWFREHNNIYNPYANDPLMINLEWTYDSDSEDYSFQFGHFW